MARQDTSSPLQTRYGLCLQARGHRFEPSCAHKVPLTWEDAGRHAGSGCCIADEVHLPTQHVLYFGIQAKKGKLDSAGMTPKGNHNVAEVYNQVLMMLHFAKDETYKYKTINARCETVAELPTFREPLKHKRCLVLQP
jgi:SOS response associated peptidase (SRAP)